MKEKDPLLAWRREFPILARKTYLISNSLGAMPRKVYGRLKEYADTWATDGVLAWDEWIPRVAETGDLIGRILGAPKGTVMMHQNVSTLQALVASCFEFRKGRNRVVCLEQDFPTIHYVWKEQERRGARVVLVPSRDGIHVDMDRLLSAIDRRTAVVSVSLVQFRSAAILDAKAVIRKAHAVGAKVVLDCYQATGVIPVDARALGVDFLVGGSVKWLCGGPGACYLYVRRDLIRKFHPAMTGWFSHAKPFAFEPGKVRFADTIYRYMGGSPSVPALYAARSGYEIVSKVGVERIREKSMRQTRLLISLADAQGLKVNTPREDALRAGTVSLDFPGSERACGELIRRGFIVDHRPRAGIRISPHFYNSDDECRAVLEEVRRLRRGRAFAAR